MNARHIRLIAVSTIPALLRSGTGIVYTLLTVTVGLTFANLVFRAFDALGIEETLERADGFLRLSLAAISLQVTFGDLAERDALGELKEMHVWVSYLIRDQPALLSLVLLLQMVLVPLYVASGAFNQLAGDLQHGAVRYQLLRTTRTSLFLGRFAGTAIYTAFLMVALTAAVVVFMGFQIDLYEWGDLIAWGARGLVALLIISLPYVAFCSWVSASVGSPFTALVLTSLVIPAHPFLALGAYNAWEPLGRLIYLLPWGIQHWLFHPDPWTAAAAAAGCLGYTALFLLIGIVSFRRRDL
jgi:ABC-type transport system involved in multi-copper enzyme maturation permease subunit